MLGQPRDRFPIFVGKRESWIATRVDVKFRAISPVLIEQYQCWSAVSRGSDAGTRTPGVRIIKGQTRLVVRRDRETGDLPCVAPVNRYAAPAVG